MVVIVFPCLLIIYTILSLRQHAPFTFAYLIRRQFSSFYTKRKEPKIAEIKHYNVDDLFDDVFDAVLEVFVTTVVWISVFLTVPSRVVALAVGLIANFILLCIWGVLLSLIHDLRGKSCIGELTGFILLAGLMLALLCENNKSNENVAYVFFNASVFLITTNGIPITVTEREEEALRLANHTEKGKDEEQHSVNSKTIAALLGLVLQMIGTAFALGNTFQSVAGLVRILLTIIIAACATVKVAKITTCLLSRTKSQGKID